MQEVIAALLEMAKGVALSMAIVAAGSITLKILSDVLKSLENNNRLS